VARGTRAPQPCRAVDGMYPHKRRPGHAGPPLLNPESNSRRVDPESGTGGRRAAPPPVATGPPL